MVVFPGLSRQVSALAAKFYDFPAESMRLVGITGTNGKTTTSRMLAHILKLSGFTVGLTSTDGVYIDGKLVIAPGELGSLQLEALPWGHYRLEIMGPAGYVTAHRFESGWYDGGLAGAAPEWYSEKAVTIGVYFVASGVSQYLGGVVASFASVPAEITNPVETLPMPPLWPTPKGTAP